MKFFPEDASAVGHHVDVLFYLALTLTGIAFALVVGILIYFMIRYRAREGGKAYHTHGNSRKAILFTLFLALVVFLAIDVNLAYHDHFAWEKTWGKPPQGSPLLIEVQPQQFAWNIRYPGPDGEFKTLDDVIT